MSGSVGKPRRCIWSSVREEARTRDPGVLPTAVINFCFLLLGEMLRVTAKRAQQRAAEGEFSGGNVGQLATRGRSTSSLLLARLPLLTRFVGPLAHLRIVTQLTTYYLAH